MARLSHYLMPMTTDHLTPTETRLFLNFKSLKTKNIQWDELFMSESLCRYGLRQYTKMCPYGFLEAITTTAPYEVLVLPDIRTLFLQDIEVSYNILTRTIEAHRPIPILAYMFQLYNRSCRDFGAYFFCDYAATSNNTAALSWLRDPNTGDGAFPWSDWTCFATARYGHIGMLERLRDPRIDGGVCPWGTHVCWCAAKAGQLEVLIWLRNPKKGGGVCPWNKEKCLWIARFYNHTAIAAWIEAQSDDD
jgi:hypothetical protein